MTKISGIELQARREALGLSQKQFGQILENPHKRINNRAGVSQIAISSWETETRTIPDNINDFLTKLEDQQDTLALNMIDTITNLHNNGITELILVVYRNDTDYWNAHPNNKNTAITALTQRIAAAKAAYELLADGIETRIITT